MSNKVSIKVALTVLTCLTETLGHGSMYFPPTWNDEVETFADLSPNQGDHGLNYPLPDVYCDGTQNVKCSPASIKGKRNVWFTNYTHVIAPTLPEEMFDDKFKKKKFNPWGSPGSAPIFGEGCGVNGGNPNGCQAGQFDANPYGTCCSGGTGCGGYVGGKSAMEHAAEGLFDNAFVTTWTRGQNAEVFWSSGAKHRGGYAYRLCKVPEGGISKITEQCFEDGHLNFGGDISWIQWFKTKASDHFDPNNWEAIDAVRVTIGTNPAGSEWAKITLPEHEKEDGRGWAFKDLVVVPEDLEPGQYVLSFRWDSYNTPQIWSSCANINII